MEKTKKLNKVKVTIAIITIVMLFWGITAFGRYVYNAAKEAYFVARQFYFSSDVLTTTGAHYQFKNWDGIQVYEIEFELYSYLNEMSKLNYDLNYAVTATANSDKVKCTINSTEAGASNTANGTIYATNNMSKVVVYVTPLSTITESDSIIITVTASTTEPYNKTISCEFTLIVENQGTTRYSIEDVENRDYAILRLTNTSTSLLEYTLQFDPSKLRLDTNDDIYINKVSATTNSDNYINKIVFKLEGETTRYVKFYKVNKALDYTYPGVQATSPINVSV